MIVLKNLIKVYAFYNIFLLWEHSKTGVRLYQSDMEHPPSLS